ncbi:uncharacterized protein LOC111649176 [Seriola lalandi dorsalis]|uniref:uncharacterized protein LOC111649176 n=1 Tax=Seriola lalandi dorsalis TaxID=1841481 RepID=UPI000C6F4D3A|nr:uncharacterized protein LOC111649176 [Seriola lalandi dorsalis]
MERRTNRRGFDEYFVTRRHLELKDLRVAAKDFSRRNPDLEIRDYIFKKKKTIPPYPRPELQVSHLKHDTDQEGLRGIKRDGGFRAADCLQWWSLAVKPEDISAAETRLLEETYPDRTEQQAQTQHSFLGRFATSPAFLETSRPGICSCLQFCSGAPPVLRVFETVLYKQKVMYVVLVHSPANKKFQKLPLLSDDPAVCVYNDGRFTWRSQAMCETHRYQLVQRPDENQMEVQELFGNDVEFYVWDDVAIALHMEEGQVLKFDDDQLRRNLKICGPGEPVIRKPFDSFEKAKYVVEELWPDYPEPLETERSLQEAAADPPETD